MIAYKAIKTQAFEAGDGVKFTREDRASLRNRIRADKGGGAPSPDLAGA